MSKITKIWAREVLSSRGNPTVQVEVHTEYGFMGTTIVPSGASTGELEACELRDKDVEGLSLDIKNRWFGQKGVSVAVNNVNNIIAKAIVGMEVTSQRAIDELMIKLDGTKNKSKLGANAILGVSIATARAAAEELDMPLYKYIGGVNARTLPLPMLNIINGGAHATNTLDFQEFMIMPVGATTFMEAMTMANKTFHTLAGLLKADGHGTQVGDEGGFAPNLKSHEEALVYIVAAIKKAGFVAATSGKNAIAIAMDAAASEFYDKTTKKYVFKKALAKNYVTKDGTGLQKSTFSSDEMITYLENLVNKFPIISIEDGLDENDWTGFEKLTSQIGDKVQIVGDDLFVTNKIYVEKGIQNKAANSVLIKINQIGTLSETLDTIELAHRAGFTAVVSHRSGESSDTTISDLSVALNTGQIKTGSFSRTDRIAKYNRLIVINEELGSLAVFKGRKTFNNIK